MEQVIASTLTSPPPAPSTDAPDLGPLLGVPEPTLRLLPVASPIEPPWKRCLFLAVALAIFAGFVVFMLSFYAPGPGRPGIDENAYLVGGRNFAQHFTTGFHPSDDYQYVGYMWLRSRDATLSPPAWVPKPIRNLFSIHTQAGWYYPKYPAGLSVLNATAIWIGGAKHGRDWAFAIAPLSLAIAVLGLFFLTRELVGSFYAILAMLTIGTCATALQLSVLADSHTPDLACVTWGMALLVWWWKRGRWWIGALAGLVLGFAVTIRYTEALLLLPLYPLPRVLADTNLQAAHPHIWQVITAFSFLPIGPLGLAVIFSIRWRDWRSWWKSAMPIVGWAIPVGLLVLFNLFTLGHLTGYDVTDESRGFTTQEFLTKWDYAIYELYLFGVFALMPLGVAGMVLLFRRSWRWGLLLASWCIPGVLLYIAYYWGEALPGVAYLRFFLSLLPPLIIAGLWLMAQATIGSGSERSGRWRFGSIAGPLAAGVLVAAASAIGLSGSLPEMIRQHRGNLNFAYSANIVRRRMGPAALATGDKRSMLFCGDGIFPQLLPHLQFITNADCYAIDTFQVRAGGGFGLAGLLQSKQEVQKHMPVLLDQERIDYQDKIRAGKTDADFANIEHHLMLDALQQGRKVYAVLTPIQAKYYSQPFTAAPLHMVKLEQWTEPCGISFANPTLNREHPLSPPEENDEPLIEWRPQTYQMFEIRLN